jgi:hypothetical protein
MRLLVIPKLHAGAQVEDLLRHRTAEIQAVWDLYAEGICREMYGRADQPGAAILMLESASVEAARDALATLPLARLNLLDFDVFPLTPFTALQSLFQAAS